MKMSKYNTASARSRAGVGPIKSTTITKTFGGATGFLRDEKSELFLSAVSDFGGESSFYESASAREKRVSNLVSTIALSDLEWLKGFTHWLRTEANMRTISYTIALEGARALHKAGKPGARQLISGALLRADEPGEALAWWTAKEGRKIPSSVKRGIADAFTKSANEYTLAKYDTPSHGYRFADVIRLTHPKPKSSAQSDLFKFSMARRKDSGATAPSSLPMLQKRAELLALTPTEKRAVVLDKKSTLLKDAGVSWEVLASTISGGMDAKAWEAVIPSMGYMALLRNLRNFEDKGVSKKVLDSVASRLADPEQVAKSRQLPFRFLSAYRAVTGSLRFVYPLEEALSHSLANVPELDGHTLILVDRSGSMFQHVSENTKLSYADSAAVFGSALAQRSQNATLVQFGSESREISFKKSDSVLKLVEQFGNLGGTATYDAIKNHFVPGKHTRVVLITDEQANGTYHRLNGNDPRYWSGYDRVEGDVLDQVPSATPVFVWNLAGYAAGHGESGPNRTYLGGLSDQAFKLIPMLEAGYDAAWPWVTNA